MEPSVRKIPDFYIYCKRYTTKIGFLSLFFLFPHTAAPYRDGMGYLELRLGPGLPPLTIRINGANRGHLTTLFRRFFLPTGRHRIHLSGSGYLLSTTLPVSEDCTTRRTLTPTRRRTPPPVAPPRTAQTNRTTPTAGADRELLFIRDAGRGGTRVFLFLDGVRLGEIRSGENLRVRRPVNRTYNLLVILFRGYLKAEQHRRITLERAIGPLRIPIGY